MTLAIQKLQRFISLTLIAVSILAHIKVQTVNAACATMPSDKGVVSGSFNITTAGSYRVWVRMRAPDATNNSIALQLDDDLLCNVNVGDGGLDANTWSWVDWKDGDTANKIDVSLDLGQHSYKLAGREENVRVDEVILIADGACVPTGTDGSNCSAVETDHSGGDATASGAVNSEGGEDNKPKNNSLLALLLILLALLAAGLWYKRKWVLSKFQQLRNRFVRPKPIPVAPSNNSDTIVIHPTNVDGGLKQ